MLDEDIRASQKGLSEKRSSDVSFPLRWETFKACPFVDWPLLQQPFSALSRSMQRRGTSNIIEQSTSRAYYNILGCDLNLWYVLFC